MSSQPARSAAPSVGRALALVSLVAGLVYLAWRIVFTVGGAHPVLFAVLLAADVVLVGIHVLEMAPFLMLKRGGALAPLGEDPSVDIVILVTDEPTIQVRIALRSALEVKGRQAVVVVSEEDRSDVALLCKRYKLHYMAGTGPQSVAKLANDVIARTRAEFCAVLPSAIWVSPDVGLLARQGFATPDVGVVVHPCEVTSNLGLVGGDGYRATSDGDPNWAMHLDSVGAAGPVEGPVVFSRDALRATEGFAVGSSRFVLHTQLALAGKGWTTRFVDTSAAFRPADWDEDQALRGRTRLMAGRRSVARQPDMGWRPKGVSGWAQLPHLLAMMELWSVVARITVFAMVPVVALTGWLPLTTSLFSLVVFAGAWLGSRGVARRALLEAEGPFAADIRRGARLLASDVQVLRGRGIAAGRPGKAAGAQAWATLGLLIAAAVGAFAQAMGYRLNALPDLAAALTICAAAAMVWLARDSSWAVADRQHRVLPRVSFGGDERGQVVEMSPFGVDVAGHYLPGTEMTVPVSIPLPSGRRWERELIGSIVRVGQVDGSDRSYLKLQLADADLDELAYYCAVTGPTLERLGHAVRPFGFPVPTNRINPLGVQSPAITQSKVPVASL